MKGLFKFPKAGIAMAGMMLLSCSLPALAVDFDIDEVIVDGIKYGIVGTEAPYKAYVLEYFDMDEFEYVYRGEMQVPEEVEFQEGKVATVVGVDKDAFYGCDVTTVTLPNTIEVIETRGFGVCSQLTCVRLGSGIKEIKSKAFYPDAKLTTLYVDAVEPPAIAADALMINPDNVTLYVPAESVEAYKNAVTWNKIPNITTASDMVKVTEIVVTPPTANVAEMGTIALSAMVYPAEAQQKVSWTSSDTNVARVSGNGEVFGVKSGVCTIIASATDGSGVRGECKLTVGSGKVLQLNMPNISGFPEEEFKLYAEVSPEDTTVEWSVADSSVASVSADGLDAVVKLLAPGKTTLSVTASNGLSQQIDVNVKELIALTAINVEPSIIKCDVGDRIMLSEFNVTPVPENASVFNPNFSIEDTSIVDYDPEDYDMETFECLAVGSTRFIWSQDGVEGSCLIEVGDVHVEELTVEEADNFTVVSLEGITVMRNASRNDLETLPAGMYIVNGKKYCQVPLQ